MRELHCPNCDGTIKAETDDQVLSQAAAHAADKHPDLVVDDALVGKLRSMIHDAH